MGTAHKEGTSWLAHVQRSANPVLRLFCFTYAGGSAAVFRGWQKSMPPGVEIYPVELPGHGQQFRKAPYTNISDLIPAASQALMPFLDAPFAFFGHSMGSLIGFEIACHIRTVRKLEPVQLLVSGRKSPQLIQNEVQLHDLPEAELLVELKRLNGIPQKLLEYPEALSFWLPVLRADLELAASYRWSRRTLSCPIIAYGGLQDQVVSKAGIEPWRDMTTGSFCLRMLAGDHFFIVRPQSTFLEVLAQDVNDTVERLQRQRTDRSLVTKAGSI